MVRVDRVYFEIGTIEDLVAITSCSFLQFDLPYLQILRVKEFKFREIPRTRALSEEGEVETRDRERSVDNLMQVHMPPSTSPLPIPLFLSRVLSGIKLIGLMSLLSGCRGLFAVNGASITLKLTLGACKTKITCPLPPLFFLSLVLFCSSTAG